MKIGNFDLHTVAEGARAFAQDERRPVTAGTVRPRLFGALAN